ncbi:MAG: AAA family ATPase [Lachnospiraceae bacterium]|nr:AAA family ATPase [Lachnospiraceae bacterium]
MKYGSPYTPGAGTMPPYLAGRNELVDHADKCLQALAKGYPQQSVIYYGLRGVGKTVLLNTIEERADELDILYAHIEIAEKRSFIKQIANYSKKMIHRLSMSEKAKDFAKKAMGILQAFNITYNPEDRTFSAGLSDPAPYITTGVLSDDLTDMFVTMGRAAAKAEESICFFVDEIQYMKDDEMEALINALHRVNQLRLPIVLYGAGLPKVLRIFGEVKSYSERLFRFIPVAELKEEEARAAIEKPAEELGVQYTESAVKKIIELSKGYPYFIQELCDMVWDGAENDVIEERDIENTIPAFLNYLDESFFKVRYDHCSKMEHSFLFAMVKCGELPCNISNVAHFMKKKVNSISPLRAQLISKGLIYSTGRGEIDFTVPLFDEYLKRINPELKLDGE